jgi:hypothetical protein
MMRFAKMWIEFHSLPELAYGVVTRKSRSEFGYTEGLALPPAATLDNRSTQEIIEIVSFESVGFLGGRSVRDRTFDVMHFSDFATVSSQVPL